MREDLLPVRARDSWLPPPHSLAPAGPLVHLENIRPTTTVSQARSCGQKQRWCGSEAQSLVKEQVQRPTAAIGCTGTCDTESGSPCPREPAAQPGPAGGERAVPSSHTAPARVCGTMTGVQRMRGGRKPAGNAGAGAQSKWWWFLCLGGSCMWLGEGTAPQLDGAVGLGVSWRPQGSKKGHRDGTGCGQGGARLGWDHGWGAPAHGAEGQRRRMDVKGMKEGSGGGGCGPLQGTKGAVCEATANTLDPRTPRSWVVVGAAGANGGRKPER